MDENVKYRESLRHAKRIVVKVGSRVLVQKSGKPNRLNMKKIVNELTDFERKGYEMSLVSSGDIGSGLDALHIKERPNDITDLQMAAAVGQLRLMGVYDEFFKKNKCPIGQILLTHDVLIDKERHDNAQNTLENLIAHKIIPIINENDTVSTEEIKFGDNDVLAALVAILINADALILLTITDGLRETLSNGKTKRVPFIDRLDDSVLSHIKDKKDNMSMGGMTSKLQSAEVAAKEGIPVIIADGRKKNVISNILQGKNEGTLLFPKK